jgi:multicomponent Na+:H+ antiporter subunit F
MSGWQVAIVILLALLLVCLALPAFVDPMDGLAALELAGTIGTAIFLLLAQAVHRQPFVDLALVFAVLSFVGALAFARLLERGP